MERDLYTAVGVLAGLVVGFVLVGLVGLRWTSARLVVVFLAPLYSIGLFVYFLVAGAGGECSGAGASFRCWEVSYASTWGVRGSLIVAVLILLSFAPVLSARMRSRVPSVIATIAMPIVMAIYVIALWPWAPAWAAVLGAAIAGPPSRARFNKPDVDTLEA